MKPRKGDIIEVRGSTYYQKVLLLSDYIREDTVIVKHIGGDWEGHSSYDYYLPKNCLNYENEYKLISRDNNSMKPIKQLNKKIEI